MIAPAAGRSAGDRSHTIASARGSRHRTDSPTFSQGNLTVLKSPLAVPSIWRCVLLSAGLLLSGCSGEDASAPVTNGATTGSDDSDPDRCEKKLAAAIQRLQPLSMATQTRPDLVVNSLNSWLTECANERVNTLSLGEETRELLTPTADRFASAGRFTLNDAAYIRDCLMLRHLTEQVWERADAASATGIATEVERVQALFDAIHQMVTLLPDDSERVPVGLYEIMLTGRGTTADRVWLFAEALRQRQIDAVVLECDPAAKTDGASGADHPLDAANMLVAVLAQPDTLLFDPVRVTRVPAAGQRDQPAMFADLRESPRWQSAAVRMVVQPATSAVRMLVLQENLQADDAAMLYDELADGPAEQLPLRERIVSGLGDHWPADAVTVWDWPEQQTDAAGALTEEQRQRYTRLMKPFDAPFERDPLKTGDSLDDIDVNQEGLSEEEKFQLMQVKLQERLQRMNESSEEMFGRASQRLLKVRIEQVMGESDLTVIQQLQQIRIASMHDYVEIQVLVGPEQTGVIQVPLPDAIRAIHQSATGDALYWSALCQMDRGDDGAAVITLRNYRTQYPDGAQYDATLIHEALALKRLGAADKAVEVLRNIDLDETPERRRVEWLLAEFPAPDTPTETPDTAGESADQSSSSEAAEPADSDEAGDPARPEQAGEPGEAARPDEPTEPAGSSEPDDSPTESSRGDSEAATLDPEKSSEPSADERAGEAPAGEAPERQAAESGNPSTANAGSSQFE